MHIYINNPDIFLVHIVFYVSKRYFKFHKFKIQLTILLHQNYMLRGIQFYNFLKIFFVVTSHIQSIIKFIMSYKINLIFMIPTTNAVDQISIIFFVDY